MTFSLRKLLYSLLFVALLIPFNGGAQKHSNLTDKQDENWLLSPFAQKLFIANNGQFNNEADGNKVLYYAKLGGVDLYFTPKGILYRSSETKKDENGKIQTFYHYTRTEWIGCSNTLSLTAEQESDTYFTYPGGKNTTIRANGFKKIIYHNLYPGIDVTYYFPEGKQGFEYDVTVRPGADLSKVKLKYDGCKPVIDTKGNTIIKTETGDITDHAPTCNYSGGVSIRASYKTDGDEESFVTQGYDKTKTLVIDPWTTDPKFTLGGYDNAYDIDYDVNGNVYVYGGYNPFQLAKISGTTNKVIWSFSASAIDKQFFGGLALDRATGISYLIEGADANGVKILKINSAGTLVATSASDTKMNEMWRPLFNSCNHNLVIGGGGTNSGVYDQVASIDTSLTTFTNINALGATAGGHGVVVAALDPAGNSCYMAMAKSSILDPTHFNNVLVKLPLPGLTPTTYNVKDGYKFVDLASIGYVGPKGNYYTNGMNGMAATPNWLYMYDGGELKQYNKKTGKVNDSIKVTSSPYLWGGCDADICDNIYVGSQKWITVYNASLTLLDTIMLPDTVYGVKFDAAHKMLYACGKSFVKGISVPYTPLTIASSNATCTCNGTATANLCGGADTSNVTYLWSNGSTTQTITNLCGGKYKVTVTLGGCTPLKFVDSVIIQQPAILKDTIAIKSNVKCHGGYGNATVTVTGGAKPYKYSWSPSGGTQVKADSLLAGTYTVTVTDSNKCTVTATVTITQPPVFTDTLTNTTATCGKNNGSATAAPAGGIKPYTYAWSPSGQTTATASNLTAGAYIATVTDSNGCSVTLTTIVPDAGVTPAIGGIVNEKCYGQSMGSATITMIGGTGPYTYKWSPGGQTNSTAVNLAAGTYIATVTDANSCIVADTITINQPDTLNIFMVPGPVSCTGGNNGVATARVTGGTAAYTYSWAPVSGSDSTITGLTAGQYSVTVTDVNGCSASDTITVTQPANGLAAQIQKQSPVTCTGGNNGSATAGAQGGTGPYNFNWSPSGGADSTADSLSAGTYVVTVTDANGCSTTASVVITQPSKPLGDTIIIIANNKCDGDTNGSAYTVPSGGTPPYTYAWGNGSTRDTIVNLAAGSYNVTVTDSNQCVGSATATVTQPPALSVTFVNTQTACNKKNGSVVAVIPSSGVYAFAWNNGETSSKDSNLASGVYTVAITDSAGCKTVLTDTVPHSKPPSVKANMFPATCDSTNGTAYATVTGGTTPYTFSWLPSNETTDTAKKIGPGIYTVTVTDSNGCTGTANIIVADSGVTAGFGVVSNVKCFGDSNATAAAIMKGGTGPYSYTWSNGESAAQDTGLKIGTYTVTITDSHNCTATDTIVIKQPVILSATIPAGNVSNVSCYGGTNGSAFVTVTGGTGPYGFLWSDGEAADTAKALADTTYKVIVTDANGCKDSATVGISQPAFPLTVSTSPTAATCGANGSASATGHGGTAPYTYNWGSAYPPGATITGIGPGTYTVVVTDSNGCTANGSVNVIHSGQNASITSKTNVKCFGANDGTTTLTVVGGDSLLYGFLWSPGGQTTPTVNNLPAGVDTVFVTYIANGCVDTIYDTITQPTKIILTLSDTSTCSSTTASAKVTAVGGTPPYTYNWNTTPPQTTPTANLPNGTFTVTVTDSYNCPATAVETVNALILNVNFQPVPDTVLAGEFTYFKNTSANAVSYWWTFGNGSNSDTTNPYQQYITAGIYYVTLYATSARGCLDSITKPVYVIENLYIPNVFTPNGDGINDAFHITAGNMKEFDLQIFNRWGELIFESKSPNNDWTGTSNSGVKEAEGTYYYILKATDYENKNYSKDGYVELIR